MNQTIKVLAGWVFIEKTEVMNKFITMMLFLQWQIAFSFSASLDEKCQQNKTLNIHFWQQQPYIYNSGSFKDLTDLNGIFPIVLQESLKFCCQATVRVKVVKEKDGPAGLMDLLDREDFDIVVPVNGLPTTRNIRGFAFVGVVQSTGVAILMAANASGAKLLLSVLQAWPVLVFIIVSAILAGVLMWFLVSCSQFFFFFSGSRFENLYFIALIGVFIVLSFTGVNY